MYVLASSSIARQTRLSTPVDVPSMRPAVMYHVSVTDQLPTAASVYFECPHPLVFLSRFASRLSDKVCLDEGGSQMDSLAFSEFLFENLEHGGSRLTFVVGGAEGLPPGLKRNPPQGGAKLSLSKMTLTHLWARALLAEQIYRASEIRRGSKYHKE